MKGIRSLAPPTFLDQAELSKQLDSRDTAGVLEGHTVPSYSLMKNRRQHFSAISFQSVRRGFHTVSACLIQKQNRLELVVVSGSLLVGVRQACLRVMLCTATSAPYMNQIPPAQVRSMTALQAR